MSTERLHSEGERPGAEVMSLMSLMSLLLGPLILETPGPGGFIMGP